MSNPYYPRHQQQDELPYHTQHQQQQPSSSRIPFDPHRQPSYQQQQQYEPYQRQMTPEPPMESYNLQPYDGSHEPHRSPYPYGNSPAHSQVAMQPAEQWEPSPRITRQQQQQQQQGQQRQYYATAEDYYYPYDNQSIPQPSRSNTAPSWNAIPLQPSSGQQQQHGQSLSEETVTDEEAEAANRPIDWDKLTPEQRKIAQTFPKDLDEEGSTMKGDVTKLLKGWRNWVKWRYWYYYVTFITLAVLVAMFSIYHRDIIDWLTPISKKVNSVAWGWVIPVAILFVISFPPLFGQEVVGILCGVVYPFWIAFGVLSLGTLLGEIGNFIAFGWCLQGVAARYERRSLNYACMAHIVREGGFMVILIARLSAIPGHFTTAVFATVGMSFWIFTLAAILSLPKQLAVVYIGRAIAESGTGEETTQSKIIKWVVLIISAIITILAAVYLYRKMERARPIVQSRLRAKRYTLLTQAGQGQVVLPTAQVDDADEMSGSAGSYGKPPDYNVVQNQAMQTSYPPIISERSSSHRRSWNPFARQQQQQQQQTRAQYPEYPLYEQRQDPTRLGILSQAAPMAAHSSVSLLPNGQSSPAGQYDRELAPNMHSTHQLHREGDISVTQDPYEQEEYTGRAL